MNDFKPGTGASGAWDLDRDVAFLNHGSFGACPRSVLDFQNELRRRMEQEPVRFFARELPGLLDDARSRLAAFVGADPGGLAFVANATTGVNTVLSSFSLNPGDEVIVTDHEYPACRNALDRFAAVSDVGVVTVKIPFPLADSATVVERVLDHVTPRTRLALLDHVTSQTALILPIEGLVRELEAHGIAVLVDGAHAPGMLGLDIEALGASFYTGNCHKWLCAPKGAAFLAVRRDRMSGIRPLVTSHGASLPEGDRARFRLEFDWVGTDDPTAFLSVPAALEIVGSLVAGGWSEVRRRNRELVLEARRLLCDVLEIDSPCPDSMIGSMASLPLPDADALTAPIPPACDPLQDALLFEHAIEVPVITWPTPPYRLIRISAQLYNGIIQYRRLAMALRDSLSRGMR